MVDKKSQTDEPKEYRFQAEEFPGEYGLESEVPEGDAKPKLKLPFRINKKVVTIAVAIVIILIIYEIVVPKKSKVITPAPVKASASNVLANADFAQLSQQVKQNNGSLQQLQDKLTATQTTINNMGSAIYTLNTTIRNLAQQVQQIEDHLKTRTNYGKAAKPKITYHVRAVVPGRAWLVSSRGVLVTVRSGSKLKGYGVIQRIDPDKGIVTTSSGLVIRYGVNDI